MSSTARRRLGEILASTAALIRRRPADDPAHDVDDRDPDVLLQATHEQLTEARLRAAAARVHDALELVDGGQGQALTPAARGRAGRRFGAGRR